MKICVIGSELFRSLKDEAIRVFIEKDYDVYDISRLSNFHKSYQVISKFIDKSDACYFVVSDSFVDDFSVFCLGYALARKKRAIANTNKLGELELMQEKVSELIEVKEASEV